MTSEALREIEDLLIARLARARPPDFDAFVQESIRDILLDTIGVAIAGHDEPAPKLVRSTFDTPPGASPILGTRILTSPLAAARVNGTAAHALDFDDSVQPAMSHPSAVLVPAILALAPVSDGRQGGLVDAYWHGLMTFYTLGHLLNPGHYNAGWHATATLGRVAATAAGCRLLALDESRCRHALSIVVSSCSGVRANFGTMVKPFHAGLAAHDAVASILLAAGGFEGSSAPVSDRFGFAGVFSGSPSPRFDSAIDTLGEQNLHGPLKGLFIKPYAACGATQTTIHAGLMLRRDRKFDVGSVDRLEVRVNPRVIDIVRSEEPRTGLEAKFSLSHALASALVDGEAGIAQFTDSAAARAEIADLRHRVTVVGDDTIGDSEDWPAVVTLVESSGRRETVQVDRAPGKWSAARLTWDEVLTKFRSNLSYGGIDPDTCGEIEARVGDIGNLQVGDLRQALIGIGRLPDARVDSTLQ